MTRKRTLVIALAWWFTYPCWYGPDERPVSVFVGPFTTQAACASFQNGMAVFIGPLVTDMVCSELIDPRWPKYSCPDTKE
jgi:hypothetical protein